jgi:hypothetical protein
MAKETVTKENAVTDALRRLREEEIDLITKLKPIQEAIAALEKIVDKTGKKVRTGSSSKDNNSDGQIAEESLLESAIEA